MRTLLAGSLRQKAVFREDIDQLLVRSMQDILKVTLPGAAVLPGNGCRGAMPRVLRPRSLFLDLHPDAADHAVLSFFGIGNTFVLFDFVALHASGRQRFEMVCSRDKNGCKQVVIVQSLHSSAHQAALIFSTPPENTQGLIKECVFYVQSPLFSHTRKAAFDEALCALEGRVEYF